MVPLLFATTLMTPATKPMVVAYVPNWIDLAAFAETIDYTRLTHLDVAFENPVDAEGNLSSNPANAVLIKKAHAKGVKVLISIGGGYLSEDAAKRQVYFDLIRPERRAGFVAKLANYVDRHGFDGLDVDLEGSAINGDYGAFVQDLSKALRPKGKLLTAALSGTNGGSRVPPEALRRFDFVNVMAYDATGPWRPQEPGQHASLEFAKESVAFWVGRGLPKSKIVLGVPFYGYGFGPDANGDQWSFAKILAAYPGAEKVDRIGKTIWYNGIPTMRAKGRYVVEEGLGGAMIWSLDSDAKGDKSLLRALHAALHGR